jgi:ATP-dependent helicase HepA
MYSLGQRYSSRSEPELGLGLIHNLDGQTVEVLFPGPQVSRHYEKRDAPLERIILADGTTFSDNDIEHEIFGHEEFEGCVVYHLEDDDLHERDLPDYLELNGPVQRLLGDQLDPPRSFDLRHEALLAEEHLGSRPTVGLQGGRIELYPHQLDLADQLCHRQRVRAMLCDEVGLGKTIEAALIAHRLLLSGRIARMLIVVPPALSYQWFAELYLRFHLSCALSSEEELKVVDSEQGMLAQPFVICSLEHLDQAKWEEENWDLLIVDEAHHIVKDSNEGRIIETLSAQVEHLLFLSATPSNPQDPEHFWRLACLEPDQLDFDSYLSELELTSEWSQLAEDLQKGNELSPEQLQVFKQHLPASSSQPLSPKAALQRLLDAHGPGYHMVKNTRRRIGGFPERQLQCVSLEGNPKRATEELRHEWGWESSYSYRWSKDPRFIWLQDWKLEYRGQKALILCDNRLKVESLAKALETSPAEKCARFHEDMSTLERDRMAAWFNDPKGPDLLISSNLGAEGRNFQVASHLIMMDLPLEPALLEQRIGRIDRIGQKGSVQIHVPVITASPQEQLCRWHDQVFNGFAQPWCGVDEVFQRHRAQLMELLSKGKGTGLDTLIEQAAIEQQQLWQRLEHGRDPLLELCWWDMGRSEALAEAVRSEDEDSSLEHFMINAWELWGLDCHKLGKRSHRLKAGQLYQLPFPGFKEKGMTVSFDRRQALLRDDAAFISWDHPMVSDGIAMIASSQRGRASACVVAAPSSNLLIEMTFRIQHRCPKQLCADRYLPPQGLRFAFDKSGKSIRLNSSKLMERAKGCRKLPMAANELQAWLQQRISQGEQEARLKAEAITAKASQAMNEDFGRSEQRLTDLLACNPAMNPKELEHCRQQRQDLQKGLAQVVTQLDSIRLIFCQAKS